MGVFIMPILAGLQLIPAAYPGTQNADPVLDSPWFWVHVASLLTLDAMNLRAVVIGWLFLTVGVVVGLIWTAQARQITPADPNLQAMWVGDPKIFIALVTWVLYSFALVSRRTMGWSGRRAAWLSALGFAVVLLNFLPISYFVETSHTF